MQMTRKPAINSAQAPLPVASDYARDEANDYRCETMISHKNKYKVEIYICGLVHLVNL